MVSALNVGVLWRLSWFSPSKMEHFIFSWEFVIVSSNVFVALKQDAFNTVPVYSVLDFQKHIVEQIL